MSSSPSKKLSNATPSKSKCADPEKPTTSSSLDEIQQRMAAYGTSIPDLFAIITWGCTASKWLARGLNGHPDILCTHDVTNSFHYGFDNNTAIDAVHALQALSMLGMGYPLAGDVHGISRTSVQRLKERFGQSFRVACIIRDPEPRLESLLAVFEQFDYVPHWEVDYVATLPGYASVAPQVSDYRRKCFVHAVNMLNAIIEEVPLGNVFRYEDLTTKPEKIIELIHCISGGAVVADRQFCASMLATDGTNMHRARQVTRRTLDPWQFDVIRLILRPEARRLYESFDYRLPASWS